MIINNYYHYYLFIYLFIIIIKYVQNIINGMNISNRKQKQVCVTIIIYK